MNRKYANNRIRELRVRRGLSMEQVALSISPDVALATIGKLETGKMALSLDWMLKIAKALGVSASEIVQEVRGYRMLPVLDPIAIDAISEAIEHAHTWIPVPGDWWNGREFAFRIADETIAEMANPGDLAVVDPDDAALSTGKFYVVMSTGAEIAFKRFENNPPRLVSCFRGKMHKPTIVGSEPFTVIGRVVTIIRNLR